MSNRLFQSGNLSAAEKQNKTSYFRSFDCRSIIIAISFEGINYITCFITMRNEAVIMKLIVHLVIHIEIVH